MLSKSAVSVVRKAVAGATALGIMGGLIGSQEAQAHRRDFPYTYDWRQPIKGEKEIELKSRYRGRNNSFRQELEFEYGITNRWMIAPYLEFQKTAGSDLKYTAWKLETRYQLDEFEPGKVLPGLYAEYIGAKDAPDRVEGKLILSRYGKNGDDLSFNYVIEKPLSNGAQFENVYSFGYARPVGNNKWSTRAGMEWIHNLNSGRINAGPTIGFAPSDSTWVVAGYALPVNSRGGNKGEFRLVAEYEWF